MLNQGLTGLVLQVLERRCGDEDGQGVGLGFQVAGAFSQSAQQNFAHGYLLYYTSIHQDLAGTPNCIHPECESLGSPREIDRGIVHDCQSDQGSPGGRRSENKIESFPRQGQPRSVENRYIVPVRWQTGAMCSDGIWIIGILITTAPQRIAVPGSAGGMIRSERSEVSAGITATNTLPPIPVIGDMRVWWMKT
jgi:hypothetical protein